MFDGTIISKGNSGQGEDGEMVDVEDDETATYGPPQYPSTSQTCANCTQSYSIEQ